MNARVTYLHRGIGALAILFQVGAAWAQSGALDTSFDPGTGANGGLTQSIPLGNGSYLIAGAFTNYNGTTCGNIARILPNGSIDPSFLSGAGFNAQVNRIAVQSDGSIIAIGLFTQYDGNTAGGVARLFTNGAFDPAFTPINPNPGNMNGLEVLPDDRFVLSGFYTVPGASQITRCARFNPDGSVEQELASFANVNGTITSTLSLGDGRTVIVGGFTTVQGSSRNGIAMLTVNGTLDPSFSPGSGFNDVATLPVQQVRPALANKIFVVGPFTSYNGTAVNRLVRLGSDGAIDPTWNTTTTFGNAVNSIQERADGTVLCSGSFTQVNGSARGGLCALSSNGSLLNGFPRGVGAIGTITTMTFDPSGRLFISGGFASYNDVPRSRVARLIHCITDEWYADADADGAGAAGSLLITCAPPVGYVSNATDCDDSDPLITNGTTWYADADADGFGDASVQQIACSAPVGFVGNDDDCNDAAPSITGPILWYLDLDGDGFGNVMAPAQLSCTGPTGRVADNTDCNDFDPSVHELSNWYADTDGDGFGNAAAPQSSCSQPPGHVLDNTDCNDSSPSITGPSTWYLDGDGDNFGVTGQTLVACSQPLGYSAGSGDCDDLDPLIYPNAPCNDGNAFTHFDRIRPNCTCAGQGVQVSPIVYLDVPLNSQGWMDATLLANGLLPTGEPYSAMGYQNFANGVGGASTTPQMLDPDPLQPELKAVDWVVVELRSVSSPTTIRGALPCLLRRNGSITRADVLAPPEFALELDDYFIAVRHRNHLGVITANAVTLDQPGTVVVNFSDGTVPVNGGANAMKPNGSKLALWPGDVRFNRNVQYAGQNNDRDQILVRIGGTVPTNTVLGYFNEDVNLDGAVKYTGTNNDRDKVLQTIGGVVPTNIRLDHLPN